jgi:hypothetical protein
MSIATTSNGQALLLVASILALFVIPITLWLLLGVGRIVRLLTGVDVGGWLVVAAVAAVPLALLYASLRLDEAGEIRTAQVTDRTEHVTIQSSGDWRHERNLTIRYSGQAAVLGDVDAGTFGHTPVGASIEVRALRLADQFSLVRLPGVSTSSLVPWYLVQPAAVLVAVGLLVWRLRRTSLGGALLVAAVLGAAALPLVHADELARERADLSAATQHATARVVDVSRVTRIDIGGRRRSDLHDVPQPYDIVQIDVPAPGAVDNHVLAVDAVDADDAQPIITAATVAVVYPPDGPQDARLEGRARTHYLKTTLGVYQDYALIGAGVLALLLGLTLFGRVFGLRRPSRATGSAD